MNQYILSDFQPFQICKPIPQKQSLDAFAYYTALARSSEQSSLSFDEIYKEVSEQIYHYGISADYISQRQLIAMPHEFLHNEYSSERKLPFFFQDIGNNPKGASLGKRMEFFHKQIYGVFFNLYKDNDSKPNDLIHATCTGYFSPSPAQELVVKKEWFDVTVTHSYHMGCYGAFPPVRMATGFLAISEVIAPKKSKVDIVHTEASSYHFYLDRIDAGHIVNMTLFADGFIRYSVKTEKEFQKNKFLKGLQVLAMKDHIIENSLDKMKWAPDHHQFEMFLSREVPVYLKNIIDYFANDLCKRADIDLTKEKEKMIFAIHPGGPKILNHIRDKMNLNEAQVQHSRSVLFHHGNMSSATIPHIWKEILDDDNIYNGQKILTMAFGPGLTATGFILKVIK